jgi:hypothetical protein
VASTPATKRSTTSTASSSPACSVSRVYPARSANAIGDAQPPEVEVSLRLHVADDVLLDEVAQQAPVQPVHHRRGERQQVGGEVLHLLRHLQPGHAVAHQRLVDVEVEQLDLGVGDLGERLAVDAGQLEEGDQREARLQDRGAVLEQVEVGVGEALARAAREAERAPDALDQRRLEPRPFGGLAQRVRPGAVGEQLLEVAVGEPPALHCRADLRHRVAALTEPRDDPRLGDRRRRPSPAFERHDPGPHPASQRVGRDVDHPRHVRGRDAGHQGTDASGPRPLGSRCGGAKESGGTS